MASKESLQILAVRDYMLAGGHQDATGLKNAGDLPTKFQRSHRRTVNFRPNH
jgi:hypothetical protein